MPKSKETISDSESGSASSEEEVKSKSKPKKEQKKKKEETSSSEESESEEDSKSKKRSKKGKDDKGSNKKAKKSKGDENIWDLGSNRQVNIRNFKGRWFVDIREMYEDRETGELKPGKKGICMNLDTWRAFTKVFDEVDKRVKAITS